MAGETLQYPPEVVYQLAQVLYSAPERLERGAEYACSRGLDPAQLMLPWAMSDGDPRPFEFLRRWDLHPSMYVDRLFIPVTDLPYDPAVTGQVVLAGFDMRYCGTRVDRAKYVKLKRDVDAVMLYNIHEALASPWAILVESAIDAETIRQLPLSPADRERLQVERLPVVAALTAKGDPQFAMLLHGLFERVYLAYDNDKGGASGAAKMIAAASRAGGQAKETFRSLAYSGEDANHALLTFGADKLRRTILSQVG